MHPRLHNLHILFAVIAVMLLMTAFESSAQETVSNTQVSKKTIEARKLDVKADTELAEELRTLLLESYDATLAQIEIARANSAKAEAFALAVKTSPDEESAIRSQIDGEQVDASEVISRLTDNASVREIQQHLQVEKAHEATESANLSGLEQKLAAETKRPEVARQTMLNARDSVAQLTAELQLPISPEQAPLLTETRRWSLSSQTETANAEIIMLEQELLSQPVRVELLVAKRDLSIRTLKNIGARILLLEKALADARISETEQIIAESGATELNQTDSYPVIVELVTQNRELSEELHSLTDKLSEVQTSSRRLADSIKEIETSFATARQRLEVAGLNKALGKVLHEQRRDLPDFNQFNLSSRQLEDDIADAGLHDIRLTTELRELRDKSKYIEARLVNLPAGQRDELIEPLTTLVENRRALLKNTIDINSEYLRDLAELNFQQSNALKIASEFDSFLVENLLWVRNKTTISLGSLTALPGELADALSLQPWIEAIQALVSGGMQSAWLVLAMLITLLVIWKKKALIKLLRATAKPVGIPSKDNIVFTLKAFAITLLLALPIPLLTLSAGWELGQFFELPQASQAIGISLRKITIALFFQRLISWICLEGGLGQAHFKWSESITQPLKVQTNRLWLTALLPLFVMILSVSSHFDTYGGELARILFVIAISGMGMFLFHVLKPEHGILRRLNEAKGYSTTFSWFWFLVGLVIPITFALAALAGYLYSAITLMARLIESLWFLFGLIIIRELISRWLLVLSGRIQLQIFREKREARQKLREREQESSEMSDHAVALPEEPPSDVASISADTTKLVSFVLLVFGVLGLSAIWSSVLPALSVFGQITMWEFLDGAPGQQQVLAVTLADLLLAIVYLFMTIFASKSIPPLIKVLLRYSSSITPGSRVAFAMLARYSIVIAGVSIIANTIGWNWNKIQWLVAAMSVGIGFGLQEIIANFISGIIILVERPIRVGDLVTVGETSGTVTRLQIRATTVTNFDRQELLVPNKEFITSRVLNWSLSDDVIRLVVKVGVAYGTDMNKALELVKQAIVEHDLVLKDPKPLITFTDFGDNSLNITGRCLIASLNKRREVHSDLNLAINQKFIDAGIVIAFPQRDVHLNTVGPLDIRVRSEKNTDTDDSAKD